MIRLEDFIKTTLLEIARGVKAANDEISDTQTYEMKSGGESIDFDVAVTVENENSSSAGMGAIISVISIGGKNSNMDKDQRMSRVKFSVKVHGIIK